MITGPEWLLIGAVAAVGVLHTVVPDHWVPITHAADSRFLPRWSRGFRSFSQPGNMGRL
jgi:hypothetical protein